MKPYKCRSCGSIIREENYGLIGHADNCEAMYNVDKIPKSKTRHEEICM
jgi:hypothetical protein